MSPPRKYSKSPSGQALLYIHSIGYDKASMEHWIYWVRACMEHWARACTCSSFDEKPGLCSCCVDYRLSITKSFRSMSRSSLSPRRFLLKVLVHTTIAWVRSIRSSSTSPFHSSVRIVFPRHVKPYDANRTEPNSGKSISVESVNDCYCSSRPEMV
jgi:hypothetical protein